MSPASVTVKWLKKELWYNEEFKELKFQKSDCLLNINCNMAVEIERCDIFSDWCNLKAMHRR